MDVLIASGLKGRLTSKYCNCAERPEHVQMLKICTGFKVGRYINYTCIHTYIHT